MLGFINRVDNKDNFNVPDNFQNQRVNEEF